LNSLSPVVLKIRAAFALDNSGKPRLKKLSFLG
jgi:hypothetical protein